MQCHNCKYNGKGSEQCLTCNSAEYLDNDHKTVSPVDDVTKIMAHIDKTAEFGKTDNSLEGYLGDRSKKTTRAIDDCLNVLDSLKKCHHSSLPFIHKMVAVLMAAGTGLALTFGMLNGQTLSEYANENGVSRQSVQQKWSRVVERAPELANVPNRGKSKSANKNAKNKKTPKKPNNGTPNNTTMQPIGITNTTVAPIKRKKVCLKKVRRKSQS